MVTSVRRSALLFFAVQAWTGVKVANRFIFSRGEGGKMIVTCCTQQLNMFLNISGWAIAQLPTPGCRPAYLDRFENPARP